MKKFFALLMVLVMSLSLVACGSTKETDMTKEATTDQVADTESTTDASSEAVADTDIKVGVILKTLSSEYWGYVAAGVKAAEADLGVTVQLQGPASETSYDEQNNMIETMLSASDIDALVIAPLQADSISTVLSDTTIPILFVDTDAPYDAKLAYIGTGNDIAAYQGGEYAASLVGEGAKAVFIGGVQGNTTSDEREKGYVDALEANGVEVVANQYAEGLADKAASIMENLLTSLNNDVDIVVCSNDDMAAGVARVIEQAGLEDVIIIGFDGIQAGVQNVIDGRVTATVAQSPFNMGYKAVENAVAVAKGEKIQASIDTGSFVITGENAQEYLSELKEFLGE